MKKDKECDNLIRDKVCSYGISRSPHLYFRLMIIVWQIK